MKRLIITIDGPAGSGKSTVSQLLARRLGLRYLDTGAMYRALAASCLTRRIAPSLDPKPVVALARDIDITFDWGSTPPRVMVDGRDVSQRVRDPDVTQVVSDVASIPQVRQIMVDQQRRIGSTHPYLVTEGRDQGTVVFPDAEAKFYLDASLHVRAQRRHQEFHQSGHTTQEEEVREAIDQRDQRDRTREEGPLDCPPDAIRVDVSEMTIERVVEVLEQHIRERVGDAHLPIPSPSGSDPRDDPRGEG